MKRSSIIAWLTLSAWLSACGGGGNTLSTTPAPTGGPTASSVTSLSVATSAAQIAADGSVAATISATAKDANNNVVSGAAVKFSASAGGLAVTQATTDANGLATATLRAGGAPVGTAITVTAAAGSVNGKVAVSVIDIKQTIGLITSLPQIPSDSSKKATITALVRDANNNFMPNVTVSFHASSGGLAVTQAVTDAGGAATA
ncbi:MAG: Ig-like domain-containing protein, partial [Pseudomonadota bacterium]|nr:Ig-like domain-containing protein [Pseudomonadota bacterium]